MSELLSSERYIAISGLIGAGKSTLADALGAAMKMKVYHEEVKENPYLAPFYTNMKEHAFALQVHLLERRMCQQQQIMWTQRTTDSERGVVQDRSIYEDLVFARMLHKQGLMSELNLQTYHQLFKTVLKMLSAPSLIVYLDVAPEEALRRIKQRGRPMEAGITLQYLTDLHAEYEAFIDDISKSIPVLRIDYVIFHSTDAVIKAIKAHFAKSNVRAAEME